MPHNYSHSSFPSYCKSEIFGSVIFMIEQKKSSSVKKPFRF